MIRPLAVGLFAMMLTCGASATSAGQDLEPDRTDVLPLNVRMTAPAGSL